MPEDQSQSNEVQVPVRTTAAEPAGVPEGTVLPTPEGQPDEKVVHDYDEDGKLVGWHKEVVNG